MKRLLVSLLGSPGSGKGTLARMCVERMGVISLSTGDLCRSHIADGTPLGKEIEKIIRDGGLVPDRIITEMVIDWFKGVWPGASGVLLDGFPRTVGQADGFLKFLRSEGLADEFAVAVLDVSDDIIVTRLSERLVCSNKDCQSVYSTVYAKMKPRVEGVCDKCGSALIRREDDSESSVRERLRVFAKHLDGLLDFYNESGCRIETITVQEQSPVEVYEEFESRFEVTVLESDEITGDRDQE